MKKWILGCTLLIAVAAAAAVYADWSRPLERTDFLMDTQVRIVLYDRGTEQAVLDGAFELMGEIDRMMNVHRQDSELSALNRQKEQIVSPALFAVIERGLYFAEASGGLFDITIRPLSEIWDFKKQIVPDEATVQQAKAKVDYRNVVLRSDGSVQLTNGAQLDLGGVAKGYAADRVCTYLLEQGVNHALIDLGGNIKAIGASPKNENGFSIGLQTPNGQRGSYFATLVVRDKSVVSSGVYERNFQKDGVTYHHIIDPRTGYPLQNGVVAATIVTESGMDADALSTTVMLMGAEQGIAFVDSIPGVECVIVREDGSLFLSEGMKGEINLIDDTYHFNTEKTE